MQIKTNHEILSRKSHQHHGYNSYYCCHFMRHCPKIIFFYVCKKNYCTLLPGASLFAPGRKLFVTYVLGTDKNKGARYT